MIRFLKTRSTLSFLRSACGIGAAAALIGLASPAMGQFCGGQLVAGASPAGSFVVGQTVTITVNFGPQAASEGGVISGVIVRLECANLGGCNGCAVPGGGPALSYLGDATIVAGAGLPAITSNHPGGSAPPTNEITFSFAPTSFDPGQTRQFSFNVMVNGVSGDATPKQISGDARMVGTCQPSGLPMGACGSFVINLRTPALEITKTADLTEVCPGDEVTYTYLVENTGNGNLVNVVVVDDNGTPGVPGDDFSPTFVGGDTNNDGILNPGEIWEYTHTKVITTTTTNIATVTADFISAHGPVQVSDSDSETVTSSAPVCTVDPPSSTTCPQVFRAFPSGGRAPYTVIWRDSNNVIIGQCNNVPNGGFCDSPSLDVTGTYCASVIDANGCESETPCCANLECPPDEGQGCTPGFWRQWFHWGHWPAPYVAHATCGTPTVYCDVFNCSTLNSQNVLGGGKTLWQVLWQGGGGLYALGRHSAAALLNAAHPDVDFGLTVAQIIQMTNDAIASRNNMVIIATKNVFEALNEQGCPLSGQLFCALPDFNEDAVVDARDIEAVITVFAGVEGSEQTQRDLIAHVLANWGTRDSG